MDPRVRRFFYGRESPFVAFSTPQVDVEVDWVETADAHTFKANLPGVKKADVQVLVKEGNLLQISGEYNKVEEKGPVNWYSLERPFGKFFRQFELPDNVRIDDIKAHQEDGVLTITVPKKPPAKSVSKKVHITSSKL